MAAPPHRSLLAEMHGRPRQAQTHAVAEAKNLAPNKPIKYVVNTHHHFDHAGGLGAFAAEGATIITHDFEQGVSGAEPGCAAHDPARQADADG